MSKLDFIVPDRRGLVAEYLLNGDAKDTSGNGYDGAPLNVTYSKTSRGYQTYAGNFNGSSSKVDLPTLSSFSDFSICLVFTSNSVSTLQTIARVAPTTNNANIDIYIESGKLKFHTYNGSYANQIDIDGTLSNWKTYFVCVRKYGTYWELNVFSSDWSFSETKTWTLHNMTFGTNYSCIGYYRQANLFNVNGSIQSVRIFNRALSETEIRNWYLESLRALGGSTLSGLMDGCVAQINTADGNELSDIVWGVAVTKTSWTATTDNLGYTRAITNPNYTWPSITYTTGYAFENLGSGWVLTQTPSGLSATGINRTTTLREVFLFNRTLSADEKNALETLCKLDYVLPFDGATRYGLPPQLKEGCVLFIPWEVNGTTAFDISWNGNHWTLVNSPTPTRGGLYGYNGLKFNGTSQSVTLPNIAWVRSLTAFIHPTSNNRTILNLGWGNTITLNASNQIATTWLTWVSIYVNGSSVNSVNLNQWNVITVSFASVNLSSASIANSSFAGTMANVVLNNRTIDFNTHRLSRWAFFIP